MGVEHGNQNGSERKRVAASQEESTESRKGRGTQPHGVRDTKRVRLEATGVVAGYLPTRTKEQVSDSLSRPCVPSLVSTREGPGRSVIQFMSGHTALYLANFVFGFDGWKPTIDEGEMLATTQQGGRVVVRWRTKVTITLASHLGGAVREDFGYGSGMELTEAAAKEKAGKESVTDGIKRALSMFGEPFACFKDKRYLAWAKREGAVPARHFKIEECSGFQPAKAAEVVPVASIAPVGKVEEEEFDDGVLSDFSDDM